MNPQAFIGRREQCEDIADPLRMSGLAALLDHDRPPWKPGVLPPLGHWLCFPPQTRQSRLGPDGHPARTAAGLLPTVELPRRMWAGSRISFLGDIPLGAPIVRTSTLIAATPKSGRSGDMLLATVRHEIATRGGPTAIAEDQDIVYRAAATGAPAASPADATEDVPTATHGVTPDPVMLFRYSALTFNAHRIHYDRDYCRDVEGYPGLVVHGPLIATLLLDRFLRHRPAAPVAFYGFHAISPIFDGERITLGFTEDEGDASLRAVGRRGTAMSAIVRCA